MIKAFKDGLTVDVKTTDGGWRTQAGSIKKYDQEGFYIVEIPVIIATTFVVHEEDMRLSENPELPPIAQDGRE